MENNARCWNVAANCIIVRKSTVLIPRHSLQILCTLKNIKIDSVFHVFVCVLADKYMHHSIGYTSSNAISLFSRFLVKNTTLLHTARHFRLFVPTESILIPSGSLYTNRSQIVPSSRVHSDVLSKEGRVDLKLMIQKLHGLIDTKLDSIRRNLSHVTQLCKMNILTNEQ